MLWFFIIVLLVLAVAYLLLPLFQVSDEVIDDRMQQNIRIVCEQMAELEASFEKGEVDSEQYTARRNELEQALLLDVGEDALTNDQISSIEAEKKTTSVMSWFSAGLLLLAIPVSAIGMYLYLGTPDAVELAKVPPKPEVPLTTDGKPDVEKLVSNLHNKMRENPENEQGWYMLGRSYMMMQRFDGAIEAYENLLRLQPEEPDVMLMLADALSMKQQGKMAGRPEKLINIALQKVPNNTTALWLSGMALEQKGRDHEALVRWQVLRPLLNGNEAEQVQLDILISRVEKKIESANQASKAVVSSEGKAPVTVAVTVGLDEAFKGEVSPEDSVFIYAKAQAGPPMPLAAKRLQVKDLPISVTLNDSMAMMPEMKLSMFPKLIVGARVSKSGNAISQDGDLFTEQNHVTHGDSVSLTIDTVLKK